MLPIVIFYCWHNNWFVVTKRAGLRICWLYNTNNHITYLYYILYIFMVDKENGKKSISSMITTLCYLLSSFFLLFFSVMPIVVYRVTSSYGYYRYNFLYLRRLQSGEQSLQCVCVFFVININEINFIGYSAAGKHLNIFKRTKNSIRVVVFPF